MQSINNNIIRIPHSMFVYGRVLDVYTESPVSLFKEEDKNAAYTMLGWEELLNNAGWAGPCSQLALIKEVIAQKISNDIVLIDTVYLYVATQ